MQAMVPMTRSNVPSGVGHDVYRRPLGDGPRALQGVQLVGPIRSRPQLGELSLVLLSMQIEHSARMEPDGFYLVVSAADAARTLRVLEDYAVENEDWPPRPQRERLAFPPSRLAPLSMLALLAFFAVTGPIALHSKWFVLGTAASDRILHGELFRAVTALTLHADLPHVLGNVAAGSIFLWAVFRRLGAGRGLFATVVAGTLGNLLNALAHWHGHRSVGASTAVFAAVGILAATQLVVDRATRPRRWTDRVMPVVGSLAILGMLGASPHADLWAHAFGMIAGGVVGFVAMPRKASAPRAVPQVLWGLAAVLIVVGAWGAAFLVGHVRPF